MNNRGNYRVAQSSKGDLKVSILLKTEASLPVKVIDISYGGLGIVLTEGEHDIARVGQILDIEIQSGKLERAIFAPAEVRHLDRSDDGIFLGLKFMTPAAIDESLTPALRVHFNRRESFRNTPPEPMFCQCQLCGADGQSIPDLVDASVCDISDGGAGFLMAEEYKDLVQVNAEIILKVPVSTQAELLEFKAIVCSSICKDAGVRIGVRFDSESTEHFPYKQGVLSRFLAEMQQQNRAKRLAAEG